MTLETLQKEMIAAMKAKDKERKDTLSYLIAAVKRYGIDNGVRNDITEEMTDSVLMKEFKIAQEQLDTCPADRVELLEEFRWKKDFLSQYVPQLISDKGKICQLVTELLKDITIVDKGQVMKIVMPQLKGKVDMKVANQVISEWFGGSKEWHMMHSELV